MDYPVRTPEQLSHILKGARRQKKLTQDAVGGLIGLKQEAVSVLENAPGGSSVARLLSVLSALGLELVVRDIPAVDITSKGEW
ncbi:helix-turn-helix domain-containing protein [Collimonas humicola]|uniref:helix-turn-helix domain-containing protein n=1 Tax=Collimonas humicola TaxID=2825886 RepID=UPI001B8A9A03|nr:helix-turn-helix domain-containing protein [Collimonas humicola]